MGSVSPYGRPNHCDICGKQGHDYMHCKEYPREGKPMHPTLKDVGKVRQLLKRLPDDLGYGYYPATQRCELVDVGRYQYLGCGASKSYFDNPAYRNCQIGRVRVAKWMALDPVEARADQMEPALGSELI